MNLLESGSYYDYETDSRVFYELQYHGYSVYLLKAKKEFDRYDKLNQHWSRVYKNKETAMRNFENFIKLHSHKLK